MNKENKKNTYFSMAIAVSIVGTSIAKYLPSKILLVLMIFLTIVTVYSFIYVFQKKEIRNLRRFYEFSISAFMVMLLFDIYLLGKTIFHFNELTQEMILVSAAIPFIYMMVVALRMMFKSKNNELVKLAKSLLILLLIIIVVIISITLYTIINISNL